MQCGQNQMTGLCGLKRYFSRFAIADFADHNYVGILAQQSAQYCLKSKTCAWVNLCLIEPFNGDLDRIFYATEIHVGGVSGL